MAELGNKLKEQRLKLGLSIREVEEITKIRSFYIDALEKENFSLLPGKVYTVGFLRRYAKLLKLDPQEIVNEYYLISSIPSSSEDLKINTNKPEIKKTSNSVPRINFNFNKLFRFGIIILALVILFSVNKVFKKPDYNPPPENNIIEENTQDNGISDGNEENINEEEVTEEVFEGVLLEIIPSKGDCWIEVTVDEEVVFSKLLKMGDEKLKFEAENQIEVLFGNAGAVEVIHNGKLIDNIGPMNDVLRKTFLAVE